MEKKSAQEATFQTNYLRQNIGPGTEKKPRDNNEKTRRWEKKEGTLRAGFIRLLAKTVNKKEQKHKKGTGARRRKENAPTHISLGGTMDGKPTENSEKPKLHTISMTETKPEPIALK